MALIEPSDVAPFRTIEATKLAAMIAMVSAQAEMVAPCLIAAWEPRVVAAAKGILLGAILRWEDSDGGALTQHQQSVGPYSNMTTFDTRQTRRGLFWPSEIEQLQSLCASSKPKARMGWL